MKKLIVTITSLFFAAGAGADEFYSGLSDGNSDLGGGNASEVVGVQPGVGDSVNAFGLWSSDEPYLFRDHKGDGLGAEDLQPNIYGNLRGNSDL